MRHSDRGGGVQVGVADCDRHRHYHHRHSGELSAACGGTQTLHAGHSHEPARGAFATDNRQHNDRGGIPDADSAAGSGTAGSGYLCGGDARGNDTVLGDLSAAPAAQNGSLHNGAQDDIPATEPILAAREPVGNGRAMRTDGGAGVLQHLGIV